MKLTVDDGLDFSVVKYPKLVTDIIRVLDELPKGQLLTIRGLAAKVRRSVDTVTHHTGSPLLARHRFKPNATSAYFGNPKTIAIAEKQFAE